MKTVVYTSAAIKALNALPEKSRVLVVSKIERYAETGAGDVKRLSGDPARGLGSVNGV